MHGRTRNCCGISLARTHLSRNSTMNASSPHRRTFPVLAHPTAFALIVVTLVFAAAGRAHASGNTRVGFTIAFNGGSACGQWCGAPAPPCPPPRLVCAPPPSWASREFERGLNVGQRDGYREGFEDGRYGHRYCADSRERLGHASRPFRDGYGQGFRGGYRNGFERGRCERRCPPPPPRRWCY